MDDHGCRARCLGQSNTFAEKSVPSLPLTGTTGAGYSPSVTHSGGESDGANLEDHCGSSKPGALCAVPALARLPSAPIRTCAPTCAHRCRATSACQAAGLCDSIPAHVEAEAAGKTSDKEPDFMNRPVEALGWPGARLAAHGKHPLRNGGRWSGCTSPFQHGLALGVSWSSWCSRVLPPLPDSGHALDSVFWARQWAAGAETLAHKRLDEGVFFPPQLFDSMPTIQPGGGRSEVPLQQRPAQAVGNLP